MAVLGILAFLVAWHYMLKTEGEGKTASSIQGVDDVATAANICGDGSVGTFEECDDGNDWDYDGCTRCLVDAGYSCSEEPSICIRTAAPSNGCGDGRIQGNEECDDGNGRGEDGCSYRCEIEPGFLCPGAGACRHRPPCGNGVIETGEECDDANTADYDGCNAGCQVDNFYTCSGTPSICMQDAPAPAF